MKVLFVCLGNICRSPLGEELLRHRARERGLDGAVEADSAGTGGWHAGEPPNNRMAIAASRHGVTLRGKARQVRSEDFDRFDLVVAMDTQNRRDLLRMAGAQEEKVALMRDYDPASPPGSSVPDPWYGGDEGFAEVFGIVDAAVGGLLDAIESESPLPG